jgi:hypothetical protein
MPKAMSKEQYKKYLQLMSIEQEPQMDSIMKTIPTSQEYSVGIGISGLSKLISVMPDHPILHIECQPFEEIKNAIQMLDNWVIHKRAQDTTLNPKY